MSFNDQFWGEIIQIPQRINILDQHDEILNSQGRELQQAYVKALLIELRIGENTNKLTNTKYLYLNNNSF